jgi:hypothetical protein
MTMPPAITPPTYPPADNGRIVVWGLLAAYPFGGMTWQVLHHLVGFRLLGFDVWYVEDSDRRVYDAQTYKLTFDSRTNVRYLARWMEALGLDDRWIFRPPRQAECVGARTRSGLAGLYREADAVFNLCGAQEVRADHDEISSLVLLETDPVANQVAAAQGDREKIEELDRYDHLFTYGANLGAPDCRVPVDGYRWLPTRPPVHVEWWSTMSDPPADAPLTTIAKWAHSGKDVTWRGETWHWSKHLEFRRFMDLPASARLPLELAVSAIDESEKEELRRRGWRITRSSRAANPLAYRSYIHASLGEFTVAKEQYVRPRSGWFSDRSVCYLASGRPVVMQDTGFTSSVPTGHGLLGFKSEEEALTCIEEIGADHHRHCQAARELARDFFEVRHVLRDVVERVEWG